MNNPNNQRGQMPEERKKTDGKPMGDQMGQKAQRKDKDDLAGDADKNKSNDVDSGRPTDQAQKNRQH